MKSKFGDRTYGVIGTQGMDPNIGNIIMEIKENVEENKEYL